MHILRFRVKNEKSAVVVDRGEVHADAPELVEHNCPAEHTEIACHDQVIVRRHPPQIAEMRLQRADGCGRHGRAHVVGVLDAKVGDGADGAAGDSGAMAVTAHQCSPGTGNRPLGGGSPLPAVAQRKAVLPLGRAEVRACDGAHAPGKAAVDGHCSEGHRLAHGRARAVQPEVPHAGVFKRKRGAHALV